MKKTIIIGGLAVFMSLAGVAYAVSGTISLSPMTKKVTPGQLVVVTVTVSPTGGSAYTVKAKVNYPAGLLEVQSFTFSDGWLPLTQTGYSLIDNTNGVLIKTAGYAGGLSSSKTLGTITFRAKSAGTATVSVAGDSMVLDASNGNIFVGGSSSVLTITSATPTPTATPRISLNATTSPTPEVSVAVTASPEASSTPQSDQTAAIGGFFSNISLPQWVLILIALLALGYWFMRSKNRQV